MRDAAALSLEAAARRHLGIETGAVRTGQIFTVLLPVEPALLRRFADEVLRDALLHEVHVDALATDPAWRSYLLVSKLPGVTDDEGASAERLLRALLAREQTSTRLPPSPLEKPLQPPASLQPLVPSLPQQIFTADVYYFERPLAEAELRRLGEELVANPLVNHLEHGAKLERLRYVPAVSLAPGDSTVETIDLSGSDSQLARLARERCLALTVEELRAIRAWFDAPERRARREGERLPVWPTDCELEILAQTWSEHCKHKEFNALIDYLDADTGERRVIDSLFKTYIQGATGQIQERLARGGARWLTKVFSDNAGVVRVDDERVFVFKVETHNSPSALEPYGGALTGILGVNRDPLGTGRGGGRLLFNTDVLCFGPPDYRRPLLTGQLHPLRVFQGVRKGIEDGGNKSGVPTVAGALVFDERYAGKPLVFCGTGALMPARIGGEPSWEKPISPGDLIVTAGGRVGKDGIHGATFSSAEIDPQSPRSAVQIGSPFTQKRLADLLEVACARGLVRCTTDNGAGGLSSSVGELATISGGAEVELDGVPLKYPGLRPWEIFVSESQERMTLAVAEAQLPALAALARERDVEVSAIGRFTDSGRLEVRHAGRTVASLDLDFLHDGVPRKRLQAEWRRPRLEEPARPARRDHGETLHRLLGSLDICSREPVIRQFDHEVKGRTVVKPLMGPRGLAPQDAAVLRLGFDSWLGVAVAHGILPRYGDLDAYASSAGAFDEAVRSIVAVGGRLPDLSSRADHFWSANDNFCVPDSVFDPQGNPDGRYKLAQLVRMCEALYDLSTFFGIPLTSGKDSMKNDLRADGVKISVPPTVLYSMAARLDDVRRCVTAELKAEGDLVYQIGPTFDELGGSQLYRLEGELGANVPRVRREAARDRYRAMAEAHGRGLLESCHDLSDGGLAVALAEAAFGGVGLDVTLDGLGEGLSLDALLYSESHSRFLVSVRPERAGELEAIFGADCARLGVAGGGQVRVRRALEVRVDEPVDALVRSWSAGLEGWV